MRFKTTALCYRGSQFGKSLCKYMYLKRVPWKCLQDLMKRRRIASNSTTHFLFYFSNLIQCYTCSDLTTQQYSYSNASKIGRRELVWYTLKLNNGPLKVHISSFPIYLSLQPNRKWSKYICLKKKLPNSGARDDFRH